MFTGIVDAVGLVQSTQPREGDLRLRIASGSLDLGDVALGDSIATNGVCLTLVKLTCEGFEADVSRETLQYSTLQALKMGNPVNLEKALTLSTRLGGHLVSGHVDGVGEVLAIDKDARSVRYRLRAPESLAKYIAHKGSICVDGVSLTVNAVQTNEFELNIVPHTIEQTIIAAYQVGSQVNLEVDVIARYLERLMGGGQPANDDSSAATGIDLGFLAEHGFFKD
ncbi:MAG: riboflavin synthase [Spongiibacteraceae bacterium]|nr:riboflavin synthase [Spongiibacteraceae bacterium]